MSWPTGRAAGRKAKLAQPTTSTHGIGPDTLHFPATARKRSDLTRAPPVDVGRRVEISNRMIQLSMINGDVAAKYSNGSSPARPQATVLCQLKPPDTPPTALPRVHTEKVSREHRRNMPSDVGHHQVVCPRDVNTGQAAYSVTAQRRARGGSGVHTEEAIGSMTLGPQRRAVPSQRPATGKRPWLIGSARD